MAKPETRIRAKQVAAMSGLSAAVVSSKARRATLGFPDPVEKRQRLWVWNRDDVEDWCTVRLVKMPYVGVIDGGVFMTHDDHCKMDQPWPFRDCCLDWFCIGSFYWKGFASEDEAVLEKLRHHIGCNIIHLERSPILPILTKAEETQRHRAAALAREALDEAMKRFNIPELS